MTYNETFPFVYSLERLVSKKQRLLVSGEQTEISQGNILILTGDQTGNQEKGSYYASDLYLRIIRV